MLDGLFEGCKSDEDCGAAFSGLAEEFGEVLADLEPAPARIALISGDRDPITPTEYGEKIAASLPNSLHVAVHGVPHELSGLEAAACLEDIMLEFRDLARPGDLDTSCVANIKPEPFLLTTPD